MADEKIATDAAKAKKMARKRWRNMIERCYNPSNDSYHTYGRRGIRVCAEWRESFEAFQAYVDSELGPRPTPEHSIDRIDNDCHYEPGNLRWATPVQQQRNRTINVLYAYNGKTATLYEHAEDAGLDPDMVYNRVRYRRMPLARAIAMGPRQKY